MRQPLTFRTIFLTLALATAYPKPNREELWVARFSEHKPGSLSSSWHSQNFPKIKRHTIYNLVSTDDRTALQARSVASASAMIKKVDIDPHRFPYLEWSWKIEDVITEAKWREKKSDDFSVRLFVIFERRRGIFSPLHRIITRIAGGLPGRSLNYVWANEAGAEKFAPSPYTDNVMMVSVESGNAKARAWRVERRNVAEDFRKAFGKEPGKIVAIALMTDTDNTRSSSVAYYGDIRFTTNETPTHNNRSPRAHQE